ncbi:MAG: FAD-dependent 5-carboxymethylaminomethyl-2-thiouridine(34) oxidoreductase MnmC [Rhodospirillales bacterium]|nr:FAD-dependent 5-carboxymethylaminomethyl-2-thiouridine(34) oxidoreductase MnmC [Rhodospirillales bacterium]
MSPSAKIAIIGGGLAGTACAFVLKNAGYTPVIFEAADTLAAGASGNPVGMYNPRFFALRSPAAEFYMQAFTSVCEMFPKLKNISHRPHGSLHLVTSEEKRQRFEKMITSWDWPPDKMRLVSAKEASDLAGLELPCGALWLPDAGTVSPVALCHAYAEGSTIRLQTPLRDLSAKNDGWVVNGEEEFDLVILACAAAVQHVPQASVLPVHTVRGQVTRLAATTHSEKLKTNLCYGGYLTPAAQGEHVCGSTFQKWLTHTDLLDEDDSYNLKMLHEQIPALHQLSLIEGGRASLRLASRDRLPFIGAIPSALCAINESQRCKKSASDISNLYVSVAHGSHGIISSYGAAQLILQQIQTSYSLVSSYGVGPDRILKKS